VLYTHAYRYMVKIYFYFFKNIHRNIDVPWYIVDVYMLSEIYVLWQENVSRFGGVQINANEHAHTQKYFCI